MYCKPIKDFLLHIEDCHKALSFLYQRLSVETSDHKVKILLEYMNNKEQTLCTNLDQYIQQAPSHLLETWLDTFCDQNFPCHCRKIQIEEQLTIQKVVTLAIQLEMHIIETMQTAAFISPTIDAELALDNLINQEEETLHQVMIASHEFEYM